MCGGLWFARASDTSLDSAAQGRNSAASCWHSKAASSLRYATQSNPPPNVCPLHLAAHTRAPFPAVQRRAFAVLLSSLLLSSGRCRECGEAEINKKDISGCTSLKHIKHVGHRNALWLGDQLHHNPKLEFLDLHHTRLGVDDAISLAAGLENNTHLKRLVMHNNYVYDKGAAAIGRALLKNNALQFLSLSTNGIGDEGAIGLAEGLKGNTALRRLDLYFNMVGDKGAAAFAEALSVNRGLNSLHLDTNRVGPDGGLALAKALRGSEATTFGPAVKPAFLGELTLMYNHLNNHAADVIMDAAKQNTHLHNLALDANHLLHSEVKKKWENEHVPHFKERQTIAKWLVRTKLVADIHHHDGTPPLASKFAKIVQALKAHTPEELYKLREEHNGDLAAIAAHPELSGLPEEDRMKFAKALMHWHPVTFDENGEQVVHEHLKVVNHDEL